MKTIFDEMAIAKDLKTLFDEMEEKKKVCWQYSAIRLMDHLIMVELVQDSASPILLCSLIYI